MLTMNVIVDGVVILVLNGVSSFERDILNAQVLMLFQLEGEIEEWAVDPNITDEQAHNEVKRYYNMSYGWDMESATFRFEPKFYVRR